MKEALRYLENAKAILKSIPVEDNTYTDVKPVQEACGTAYLAIPESYRWVFTPKRIWWKRAPRICGWIQGGAEKASDGSHHNDKLLKEFEKLYKLLHIAGYYRGLLEDVIVVKDALKAAKIFVEKIK